MDALTATSWMSQDIVKQWSLPQEGKMALPNGNNKKIAVCSIIPPTYQSKIAEHYEDPEKREKSRLDLYRFKMQRLERAVLQREEKKSAAFIGKIKEKTDVYVYITESETKLPGTIAVTKNREPSLRDLQKVRKPSSNRKRENERVSNLFKYEAYYGLKNTLLFLWEEFSLRSYDNKGADVRCTVDIVHDDGDSSTNNAFWNGRQMYIGMGDQDYFTRFSSDIDILAHEFGHAVVQTFCDLEYSGQSGAMNEHFADVIGIMVKQYFGGKDTDETFEAALKPELRKPQTVHESNWLIGEKVLIDKGGIFALRSMEKPGEAFKDHPVIENDEQPAHYGDYTVLPDEYDNGGVHIYSGILNRAFVIAAKKLDGFAWDHVGKIWIEALKTLKPTSQFDDLVKATLKAAKIGPERDAVRAGWTTVGLL